MSKTDKKEKRFKVSDMLQGPKRLENESYEDYKERRKVEKVLVKQYRERISPYPHYSGIKLQIPLELSEIKNYTTDNIPKNNKDDDTSEGATTLKLM